MAGVAVHLLVLSSNINGMFERFSQMNILGHESAHLFVQKEMAYIAVLFDRLAFFILVISIVATETTRPG